MKQKEQKNGQGSLPRQEFKRPVKKAKEDCLGLTCHEIETCLNKNNSKRAYQLKWIFRETVGPQYPGQVWEMSY